MVLLRELVDKLPPSVKFDWARYRRNLPCTNLSTFSAWLYELAETICPLAALPSEMKGHRSTKNNFAFLNAHTGDADEAPLSQPTIAPSKQTDKSCVVCIGSCTSVEKCSRFGEFSLNSKWTTVRELGLCRKCLKKHNGSCRSQQVCGINGCEFKHHQLLHNNQKDVAASTESSTKTTPNSFSKGLTNSECNTHHSQPIRYCFELCL